MAPCLNDLFWVLKSTEKTRRDYRETLLRTPGLGKFISGVILYDETIRQRCADNTPIVKIIRNQKIIPGIKVDTGAKDLAGSKKEKITEGLDGLRERLMEYRSIGADFAKWRSVISIGNGIPTDYCLKTNVHALARYAALCQECGLVPIVEPEDTVEEDGPMYPSPKAGYILRGLSAVPQTLRDYWAMANIHYTPGQFVYQFNRSIRAITRPQMELIAARVSALHQCAY